MKKSTIKKNAGVKNIRKKLYSAIVMLLLSSIMLVSSTYAWFVLSTAPEVTGIDTQIGANGALEIALFDTDSYNDYSLIEMGDFDESADISTRASNLLWGNLVDLSDPTYGLSKITLLPSRLNISENGTDDDTGSVMYKIGEVLLKTPKYGEDGRIQGLVQTAFSSIYNPTDMQFLMSNTQDYGVRAIGTSVGVSALQQSLNSARNSISSNISAARTKASTVLNEKGDAIANIAIMHALSSSESYTVTDITALKELAEGLKEALLEIETGIRNLYVSYVASSDFDVTELASDTLVDFNTCSAYILNTNNSLTTLNTTFPGVIPDATYITKLTTDLTTVDGAITTCNGMIASGGPFTWAQIVNCMSSLVEYTDMKMNGYSIDEITNMYEGGNLSELVSIISAGITISVPDGSGILSEIADFAGNYSAKVTITSEATIQSIPINGMSATMQTASTVTPAYLNVCSNKAKRYTAGEGDDTTAISDFYGYALDLAFKTNAADSNLMLATESTNRIYDGDTNNPNIQGGGSFMRFTSTSGLSATRMLNLMKAIRIVFVDKDNNVLAIAALDTTVGKDAYTELDAQEKIDTGKFYKLDALSTSQLSDYITYAEYEALQDTSAVIFDATADTIEAKMYLYNYHMTISDTSTEGNIKLTGGLTLDDRKTDAIIGALPQNEVKAVSTIVYLDGSWVNNSMVAANSEYSLNGVMNLQFMSDANLIPAENSEIRYGRSTAEETTTAAGETETSENNENPATPDDSETDEIGG